MDAMNLVTGTPLAAPAHRPAEESGLRDLPMATSAPPAGIAAAEGIEAVIVRVAHATEVGPATAPTLLCSSRRAPMPGPCRSTRSDRWPRRRAATAA